MLNPKNQVSNGFGQHSTARIGMDSSDDVLSEYV